MRSLRFKELLVLSRSEKAARRVRFDPKTTILQGENHTGKSSMVKSLFSVFGAKPKMSDLFLKARPQTLLHFTIDDRPYAMLQSGETYALFDQDGAVKLRTTKVMADLAPALADLFDFRLQLSMKRTLASTIASPSAFFLPTYIDQDTGWNGILSSFGDVAMFVDAKKEAAAYHTGIRPNEFYVRRARMKEAEKTREEPLAKQQALRALQKDLSRRLEEVSFDIDIGEFKAVIDRLLERAAHMKKAEDAYRGDVVRLRGRREDLLAQLAIVQRSRKEIEADYDYALGVPSDDIDCPTCGQVYSNDIVSRFGLASEVSQCEQMRDEIGEKLNEVETDIRKQEQKLAESDGERRVVEELLAEKRGAITLKELIHNEGQKGFRKALEGDLSRIAGEIAEIDAQLDELKGQLSKFDDRARRAEITGVFAGHLDRLIHRLNVVGLPPNIGKSVYASFRQTGSGSPRAVLAYHAAVWRVMASQESAVVAPVVVDAVNQQEQDAKHLRAMFETIRDERPKDGQLIVGAVDLKGVDFEGSIEKFEHGYKVLQPSAFAEVGDAMRPYLDRVF